MHVFRENKLVIVVVFVFVGLVGAYLQLNKNTFVDIDALRDSFSTKEQIENKPAIQRLTFRDAAKSLVASHLPNKSEDISIALANHVSEAKALLQKLLDEQNAAQQKQILSLIDSKISELDSIHDELGDRLDEQRQGLGGKTLELENLAEFESKLDLRFAKLKNLLTAVLNSQVGKSRTSTVQLADQYLSALKKPVPDHAPLAPTVTRRQMGGKPTISDKAAPPAYMSNKKSSSLNLDGKHQMKGHSVKQAGLGNIDNLLVAALSPPGSPDFGAFSCEYNAEDLNESPPEVVFSQEMLELADDLDYDPLKIFNYVSNEIDFEPYTGSLKGGGGTLAIGAGSGTDQASLMIALLRISKFPARYVRANITWKMGDDRGLNWAGVRDTVAYNNDGVVPWNAAEGWSYPADEYGKVHHTFVEVCVPYDNYRGSRADVSGYHWVPLDPSYEQYGYDQGDVVPASVDLNDFFYGINGYMLQRSNLLPHEAFADFLSASFGFQTETMGYQKTRIKTVHDILPSTLPYKIAEFYTWSVSSGILPAEVATIPDDHRFQLEISVGNGALTEIHPLIKFPMPSVAENRITLRFDGATQADIDDANCGSNPMVTPVISIGGVDQVVAGRLSVPLCSVDNKLVIKITRGSDATENLAVANNVTYQSIAARNYHSIHGYSLMASELVIENRTNLLLNAVADPLASIDDKLGAFLDLVGLKYMSYITAASATVADYYDLFDPGGYHIGVTSTRSKLSYLFDLPYGINGSGFLIDVMSAQIGGFDPDTGATSVDAHTLGGYSVSAYESYIWQEMAGLDAVSSIRGIQYAYETGLAVNHTNPTAQTSLVEPATDILYGDWSGAVFIELDENGLGTYGISGDYTAGGGYTVGDSVEFYTYNPDLDIGYEDTLDEATSADLSTDAGADNVDIVPVDSGLGSNTGDDPLNSTMSGDPVNLVSGNMYRSESDISLRGVGGLDLVFNRSYNSNVRKDSSLGYGWTHSLAHRLKFYGNGNRTESVIWQNGTGVNTNFDLPYKNGQQVVDQVFTNPAGVDVEAGKANNEYYITEKNGLTFFFEGVVGIEGETAKLIRVVDKNDNTISLGYSGENLAEVSAQPGRRLTFYYDDADQHITRIVDWTGRTFRYTYSDNDLIQYETPMAVAGKQNPTTYTYYDDLDGINLDHAMASFTEPTGKSMDFEYYTNGKVFRHTDNLDQTYTFRYNEYRRETSTVDERGIKQTYLFNQRGQQIEHVQGDGSTLRYEYNDPNNPYKETNVFNALGYETTHAYNAEGDLFSTVLPDLSTITYEAFNAFSLPCTVKDPNGNFTFSRFDSNGNLIASITAKENVSFSAADKASCSFTPNSSDILAAVINSYDDHGNLLITKQVDDFSGFDTYSSLIDASNINSFSGPSVIYSYDAFDNPVGLQRCGLQHDPSGVLIDICVNGTQSFDELGRATSILNSDFYQQKAVYDDNDRIVRATDASNQFHDYAFDQFGRPVAESMTAAKADGTVGLFLHNTFEFDDLLRPIVSRNIAGYATVTQYDEIGNTIRVTNPDGYSVRFDYDELNRPLRAYDEQGHAVSTAYDSAGRPVEVTDANGNATIYEYYAAEENGRLKKVSTPDGQTLEYFYDNNGNVIRTVDNIGRENLTSYDALNRHLRVVGPLHDAHNLPTIRQVSRTTYTALGDVEKIEAGYTPDDTGAGGDIVSDQAVYSYDGFGHVVTQTDANGKSHQYIYDEHFNVVSKTSANGHVLEYTYDDNRNGLLLTQIAKMNAGDLSPHITDYTYNALGQASSVVTPELTYTYEYDKSNRLISVNDSRGSKILSYEFSPGGLLNSLSDNEGKRTEYLYDAASRLTAIIAPNNDRVNLVFDPAGRLLESQIANGTHSQYSYDTANNITQLVNSTSQGLVSQHDYSYDNVGRRIAHIENINSSTTSYNYQYDELDRMTRVLTDGVTLVEEYGYDQFSNRRTSHANGQTSDYYLYDAAQQLSEIRTGSDTGTVSSTYVYDDNGNLIVSSGSGALEAYTYDAQERLVDVLGASNESYSYDHQGKRITKTVGASTLQYLYSGMSIYSEYDTDWTAANANYTYTGIDKAIIRSTPNVADTRYYHHDGINSVVAVTDNSGILHADTRYDAWGQKISGSPIPTFGYTGREPDSTGLTYYRARYYDPSLGRFTQRDPAGFADGINPYIYVGNSPQNFTDPLGLTAQAVGADDSQLSDYAGYAADILIPYVGAYNEFEQGNYGTAAGFALLDTAALAATPLTGGGSLAASTAVKGATKGAVAAVKACCCYAAGTLVLTEDGYVAINDLQVGDFVVSEDPETGERLLKPVTKLFLTEGKAIFDLTTENQIGHWETIQVTDNHPYWVLGAGWVDSKDLSEGMLIASYSGETLEVISNLPKGYKEDTYNIEVADFHTYFVGEQKAFVHNCSCIVDIVKAVNSNLPHAIERAVERGIFSDAKIASDALKELTKRITKEGLPPGSIIDPSNATRVLVPIGDGGMAVYQVAKNGTAKLKTVLNAK